MHSYKPSLIEKFIIAIPYAILGFTSSIVFFYPPFMFLVDHAPSSEVVSRFANMFTSKYFIIWSALCVGLGVYSAFCGFPQKIILVIKIVISIFIFPMIIRHYMETGEWLLKKGFLQNK